MSPNPDDENADRLNSLEVDAIPPRRIAKLVQSAGVLKAKTNGLTLFVLAVLAGAYISLGAMLFIIVTTNSNLGWGITRLVGGASFSLGLILVVVGGAELFTGNNLIAMAWASRLITFRQVLVNWLIVYVGNLVGCLATVTLVYLADLASLGGGDVGKTALSIALTKGSLSTMAALSRGILCNALVCVAVWLAMGSRSVVDKIFAILFPITAFVSMGLEHSIANWFFLPLGKLLDSDQQLTFSMIVANLLTTTIGNMIGGTLLVAAVYWIAYLRTEPTTPLA